MSKQPPFLTLLFLLSAPLLCAFPYTVTDTDYDIEFEQTFSRAMESNLEPGPGELTIDRSRTELSHEEPWMDGYVDVSAFYEYSSYDFSGTESSIGTGRDWGMDFAILQYLQGPWSAVGSLGLHVAREKDAPLEDSVLYSVMAGGAYQFNDQLTMTFGVLYANRLEHRNLILPFVAMDWQVNEDLRIHTANGIFADYDLSGDGQTVLKAKLELDYRQYRLDKDNGGNAAIEETAWELGVAVRHYIYDTVYVEPFVEYLFGREFEVYHGGHKVSDTEIDRGLQLGITGGVDL